MTNPNITFVCCVEAGYLEEQSLCMIESLRKFGGSFSGSPIIAVKPRFGPPINKKLLKKFVQLGVLFVDEAIKTNYSWFKFLNKPIALVIAEKHAKTECMCWLDSDIFIVSEPEQLTLKPTEEFAGFPVEDKEMGTAGDGDAYEMLWKEFCKVLDIDIDSLPWITATETGEKVRMYFNGGIFVYRRNTNFSQKYLDTCIKLLDAKFGSDLSSYNVGLKEMSSIGFVAHKQMLNIRHLPYSHDYVMLSYTHSSWYKESNLKSAKVVHYHDSMWPHFYNTFLDCLKKTHPTVASWVETKGPLKINLPFHWRLLSAVLRRLRKRAETKYNTSCTKL